MAKPNMPHCAGWMNDLREVFGVGEMNAALRTQGYFAAENGHVFGAAVDASNSVHVGQMVLVVPKVEPGPGRARR